MLNNMKGLGALALLVCSMWNPLGQLANYLVPEAQAAVDPKAVAYTESRGMTPQQKLIPGSAGELGTYQLTPPAWGDLQRLMPDKYSKKNFYDIATDDTTAHEALQDYLGLLKNHYAKAYKINPTDENVLQMYNLGPTAFHRGKRNPAYVNTYKEGLRRIK